MRLINQLVIGAILAFLAGIVTLLFTFSWVLLGSTFGAGVIALGLVVYSGIEEQANDYSV